jgi:hypothetical protein
VPVHICKALDVRYVSDRTLKPLKDQSNARDGGIIALSLACSMGRQRSAAVAEVFFGRPLQSQSL